METSILKLLYLIDVKANYHTHSTWCDGVDTPEVIAEAAVKAGFDVLGFSSHAMIPESCYDWVVSAGNIESYMKDLRALAERFKGTLKILCGVEADYVREESAPDRALFSSYGVDYIIGSVHLVRADDGALVPVDASPESLMAGIRDHFSGNAEAFVRAYFQQEREMLSSFDFDIAGHLDLVRKFNSRHPYFDESASWYLKELELTAEAAAKAGRIVEVNTGAISRGWLDDAYPSKSFREILRSCGVKFVLNSDAHSSSALDCAFDRFADAEEYIFLP